MQCVYLGLSADPAGTLTEAIAIFRRLVDHHGRSDLRMGLALSLELHSLLLRKQGRDEDALNGFAEAIGLLRPQLIRIAGRPPCTCPPFLACSPKPPARTVTLNRPSPPPGKPST